MSEKNLFEMELRIRRGLESSRIHKILSIYETISQDLRDQRVTEQRIQDLCRMIELQSTGMSQVEIARHLQMTPGFVCVTLQLLDKDKAPRRRMQSVVSGQNFRARRMGIEGVITVEEWERVVSYYRV
jgi:hypothetical protein